MVKESLAEAGLAPFAVVGLVVFVAVFVAILAWTLSRTSRQVSVWSSLPLADGVDPVEPRLPVVSAGCGKCEDCSCNKTETPTTVTIA